MSDAIAPRAPVLDRIFGSRMRAAARGRMRVALEAAAKILPGLERESDAEKKSQNSTSKLMQT